jgi:O-antigen/teichoic acid export membrane protein
MKNAFISGAIIGIVSGLWIYIMHWAGGSTDTQHQINPIEYTSGLIPLIGLFFGVRSYRENYLGGKITFLEGLIEGFKILLVGGAITMAFAIWYVNYIAAGTLADFSGYIFGALLLGVLFSLAIALLLMTKSKDV